MASERPGGCVSRDFALWRRGLLRENQTCTELRPTISRHLLPPISSGGKTVDSYRRSCRNSRTFHGKGEVSCTEKRQVPLRTKGGKGDPKW